MNKKSHLIVSKVNIYIYILISFKLKYIPYKIHDVSILKSQFKSTENLIF